MDEKTQVQLNDYVTRLFAKEDDILRQIQAGAVDKNLPNISLLPFEGRLLQFLAEMVAAKTIVEIGTLAGYSAVWLARILPEDGKLITLEGEETHARIAQKNFEQAGVSHKIDMRSGNALDSLNALRSEAPFDMVFIDADKENYLAYLDWAVENVRLGGLIVAHNALRSGRVLDPDENGDLTIARYNQRIAENVHLSSFIMSVGDGMAVSIRKT